MPITLGSLIGEQLEDEFILFDLSEIQTTLATLQRTDTIDLAHAEMLQQKALRGADIVSEYLAKLIKTTSFLESKVNSTKNKAALEYQAPEGSRTTMDLRKYAAEASPEVEELSIKLAKAKGAKSVLEKKYDILIKLHHHYKDIANGLRRTILGQGSFNPSNNSEEKYAASDDWK